MRYLLVVIIGVVGSSAQAGDHFSLPFGCQKSCQECYPEVKTEPLKRHCFEVEYEEICVPGVTFYLNKFLHKCKGGGCHDFCPNPGHTKCVKKFKKVEYECGRRIVCDWKVGCKGKGKRKGPMGPMPQTLSDFEIPDPEQADSGPLPADMNPHSP